MARFNHKYHSSSTKLVFLTSCAGLLGAALIADFLWTSSYSSAGSAYLSVASNWALEKSGIIAVPNATAKTDDKREDVKGRKERTPERFLSATFADLPAPELQWVETPPALVPHLDGASIQIKKLLCVCRISHT